MNEATISHLEEHIPNLAELALRQAYSNALAAGNSVLIAENGFIYEIFA